MAEPVGTPISYHDGEVVTLDFDPAKHYYRVAGEYVPATTTILDNIAKPALIPWAVSEGVKFFKENTKTLEPYENGFTFADEMGVAEMAKGMTSAWRRRSKAAINIGTMVHKYAEDAVQWKLGKNPNIPKIPDNENAKNSIEAFRNWVRSKDIEWITSEEKLYHRKYKYAGTVDAVANIDGEFCVVDWKTSKAIYPPYYLQCAAYAKCIEDIYDKPVDAAYILRFDKETGAFESARSENIDADFIAFLGALHLYKRLKEIENRT